MLRGLRFERIAKGLTQKELADKSGVGRDTIQKLETGQRPARPATIKRLADALGIGTEELVEERKEQGMEQTKAAEKRVEVEARWEDGNGLMRAEVLRFRGEEIDYYEERDAHFTLYECPGGYRVHVDHEGDDRPSYLNPSEVDRSTGEVEYPTYTAKELVEAFPAFGEAVGVYRVRDID